MSPDITTWTLSEPQQPLSYPGDDLYTDEWIYPGLPPDKWAWGRQQIDNDHLFIDAFNGGFVWKWTGYDEWRSMPRMVQRFEDVEGYTTQQCRRCKRELPLTRGYFRPQLIDRTMICRACECSLRLLTKAIETWLEPRRCAKCGGEYPFTAQYWPIAAIYGESDCSACVREEYSRLMEAIRKEQDSIAHVVRRTRITNAGGSYTSRDLAMIRAAQTDKQGRLICWKCGTPITGKPHLDHWWPVSHGGSSNPGNLHYMHAKCNRVKSDKLPYEIGRLL